METNEFSVKYKATLAEIIEHNVGNNAFVGEWRNSSVPV
jgi:hypothetical protein